MPCIMQLKLASMASMHGKVRRSASCFRCCDIELILHMFEHSLAWQATLFRASWDSSFCARLAWILWGARVACEIPDTWQPLSISSRPILLQAQASLQSTDDCHVQHTQTAYKSVFRCMPTNAISLMMHVCALMCSIVMYARMTICQDPRTDTEPRSQWKFSHDEYVLLIGSRCTGNERADTALFWATVFRDPNHVQWSTEMRGYQTTTTASTAQGSRQSTTSWRLTTVQADVELICDLELCSGNLVGTWLAHEAWALSPY